MEHATLKSYVTGFLLSLSLTIAAYLVVANQLYAGAVLIAVIIGLAILQLKVQLYFFLHLGREAKPRWNLIVFIFMLIVLVIIVFGSLWIMNNLDYSMTPAYELDQSIMKDEGIEPHADEHEH